MSDTNVHRVVGNLLVGSSHFFVDTTNNKVGINTSSPSASLDIATGDLKVGSGITLASGGTITASGFSGNGSGLTQVNSDQGSWVNGASSNIHLAVSTDQVGIGTVDPSNLLHVYKANNDETSGILIEKASGQIPTCAALFFGVASTTETNNRGIPKAAIFYERNLVNGRGDLKFCNDAIDDTNPVSTAASDTRMIIKNNGNVGIGTVSPDETLDLLGTMRVGEGDGMLTINNRATYYNGAFMGNETMALQTTIDGRTLAQGAAYGQVERVVLALQPDYGRVGVGTTAPGSTLDVHGTDTSPIKKTAPSAATNSYNFVLNGPRPGTATHGATHFINGSTRNDDGGNNTYTIRNDSGQLRLGNSSYTTIFQGNHLRMAEGDNSYFHFGPNGTWSGELYVGATSDKSTSALKAQCISTNGNLHLDAGDTRNTYINYYSGSAVVLKHYIVSGRPLAVVGKNNLGSAGQASGVFNFNDALINSGIYNTSNGRFTIPSGYPGYYLVAFVGIGAYYNTNAPNTRWYHNGSVHNYGAYHTNLSGMSGTPAHVGVSGSHVLYLGAGDYIDLRIVGGTLYGQSSLHAYATVMYLGA